MTKEEEFAVEVRIIMARYVNAGMAINTAAAVLAGLVDEIDEFMYRVEVGKITAAQLKAAGRLT